MAKPTNPQAFAKTLAWLEAGAPHVDIPGDGTLLGFSMNRWKIEFSPALIGSMAYDAYKQAGVIAADDNSCGTVCCMAGAVLQFELLGKGHILHDVRALLGMSHQDFSELFEPTGFCHISDPAVAAKVLRHYIDTGEIDWSTPVREARAAATAQPQETTA